MKLYSFQAQDRRSIGVECRGQLVDLPATYTAWLSRNPPAPDGLGVLPDDMTSFLKLGEPALNAARHVINFISRRPALPVGLRATYLLDEVKVLAPIPHPGKILCSGINYRSHADENPSAKMPAEPFFFSKLPSAIVGPGDPIVHPKETQQLDYEVELAVVIGRKMKHTLQGDVMACVAAFTILHDVSARDVQFKDNQITLGKNFDTFCPLGPYLVTRDEIPHPENLRLRSLVNGKLMQDGSTADWVFPLPLLLSRLSHVMTLDPGDVVSTGTPAGVGVFRKPPVFLKPGDTVRLEIEKIGFLENPVINEQ